MDIKAMNEKRLNIWNQAQTLIDGAEKTGFDAETRAALDKMYADMADLKNQIDAATRADEMRREMNAIESPIAGRSDMGGRETATANPQEEAFRRFLISGETRALQADADIYGGYITAPPMFVNQLIKSVDNAVFMRGLATTFSLTQTDSLGAPSLEADPADPAWTSEIGTPSEDSTMSFGKRELKPHQLTKLIKVSNKLLRLAAQPAESLVAERLAYKFSITMENAYLNGTGAGQPLGVFTASSDGISTARDVSTGNTTTEIRVDGLINAKYALKQQYRGRAQWIFHRDAVKQIATLKDGNGQYLWQPAIVAGQPDRILNLAVNESEYVPNTFTTGLYVGILGDFKQYWIADSLQFGIQRLNELYAATNQVGFIGRMESDGAPILGEAFARVKLA